MRTTGFFPPGDSIVSIFLYGTRRSYPNIAYKKKTACATRVRLFLYDMHTFPVVEYEILAV